MPQPPWSGCSTPNTYNSVPFNRMVRVCKKRSRPPEKSSTGVERTRYRKIRRAPGLSAGWSELVPERCILRVGRKIARWSGAAHCTPFASPPEPTTPSIKLVLYNSVSANPPKLTATPSNPDIPGELLPGEVVPLETSPSDRIGNSDK